MADECLLLTLPTEVILLIATLLDVEGILALRMTCKALAEATFDRSIWLGLIHHQQNYLPFPPGARSSDPLTQLTSAELEKLVISASLVERSWLLPRETSARRFTPKLGQHILAFELFLDRFLLCVYSEGVVAVWDLDDTSGVEDSPGLCRACIRLTGPRPWGSASACLDVEEDSILVGVTGAERPSRTCILRIPLLGSSSWMEAEQVALITKDSAPVIHALDPHLRLAAFSRECFIDLINWDTKESVAISTQIEDLDQLWNGIIAVKFCKAHILCFKTRSVELHPIPVSGATTSNSTEQNNFQSRSTNIATFPHTTFRGVSVSSILPSVTPPPEGTDYRLSFLAYDVLKGLFHYAIDLHFPPGPSSSQISLGLEVEHLPTLTVTLLSVHNMVTATPSHSLFPSVGQRSSAAKRPEAPGRSGRAFVGACCIGAEGKRGVWIERTRGSTKRNVVVFSTDQDPEDIQLDPDNAPSSSYPELDFGLRTDKVIHGHSVYEVSSYDLREDLTQCVFSEVTGRIVLGTRSGHIHVL
ncbi:hypothetical protein JAAARDRAFT_41839 [Jaapia argillacea MUCL 33604]|uniref:F-box domain-containing protein n=1 Tax=Jaapia argillacea MUCL 33604 TaxID=933084 RepID=A0A067PA89_9AGAM|nr:hypothetical protein JAAARDRAFT_41839 [Jaapia argillacea MUCL 33604]